MDLQRNWRSWTRINGADDARDDLVHRRLVQRFDKARRTSPHPRCNVETANLITDRNASCLVSAHHDRKADVSRKGAASRDRHGHADAQRIDLARRDYDEAMPILHFPSGDRVRINPVDVAAAGDVAPNHQPISRPTGSPSCARATSAVRRFIPAWPLSRSAIEYRLRAELAGSATSLPRSMESVTCAPTSRSISLSRAGGMVITAAPPCLRILDVMGMDSPPIEKCYICSTFAVIPQPGAGLA